MKILCSTTVKKAMHDPIPSHATAGAAGLDLRAAECARITPGATVAVRTGLHVAIPEGYCGLVLPRSGLGTKGIILANSVGLIDSDYRGECICFMYNRSSKPFHIQEGDRVAQLLIVKFERIEFEVVDNLPSTERDSGGFGSTGVK